MTDFDDLFTHNKKEISEQLERLKSSEKIEIPRDAQRRPWSGEVDFEIDSEKSERVRTGSGISEERYIPWYGTFAGISKYVSLRRNTALGMLVVSLGAFIYAATLIPYKYHSNAHIYVPAKIDSLSSRLTYVMEKMEFASLPVEVKMPVMIIAKQMEGPAARRWVVDHMQASVNPETVSVESGYAIASETLVIHGFAGSADMASEVTDLYKKYFEQTVNSLRLEQLDKIDKWADLRLQKVDDQINEIKPNLNTAATFSNNQQKVVGIRQKLSDKVSDLTLKKLGLQRLSSGLAQVKWAKDLNVVQGVEDGDMQQMLDVYQGLTRTLANPNIDASTLALYRREKNAQELKIRSSVDEMIKTNQKEIQDIDIEIGKFQSEVAKYGAQESDIRFASGKENTYTQKIAALEAQKEELLKLKNQVQLDISVPSDQYKIILEPNPEPGSASPNPIIKFFLVVLSAFLVTGLGLIALQIFRPLAMSKWQVKRVES